jgi:hypothetical protein
MKNVSHFLIPLFCLVCGSSFAQQLIPFNNPNIYYEGRIIPSNDASILAWPGTSASIQFQGTGISAILQDLDTANYYNVIIDENKIFKIHTDTAKHTYVLASNLSEGKHTVQLFKRTEWDKGKTKFYGFEIPVKAKILPPPPPKKRKIEFFGNSITCGYAVEDSISDSGIGYFENNYATYAAITARHYNAQYHCTSKSGIGIVISWFPLLMPEMYDRLDPTDAASKWDFSKYTPDIVVVNLLQNDSWLVYRPEHEQFKYRFGTKAPEAEFIISSYQKFIASIRSKYPKAHIICALGSMDATRSGSPWPGYIQQAVDQLHDKKIYTHFFPYKNTNGHPRVGEQLEMAKSLIQFIDKTLSW